MKKIFRLEVIYKYSVLLVSLFLFLKCYEYYFFNEFYIKIPNFVDVSYECAKEIEKRGLKLKVIGEINSSKPKGIICKQNPYPGFLLKRGSNIKIFLSKGLKSIEVSNVKGESLDDAQRILRQKNIMIGSIDFIFSDMEFNKVVATDPSDRINPGDKISLLVSKGARNKVTFIPDVIGLDFETVKNILKEEGLLLGKILYKKSTHNRDTVLDVYPKIGEKVFRGSILDFVLSK